MVANSAQARLDSPDGAAVRNSLTDMHRRGAAYTSGHRGRGRRHPLTLHRIPSPVANIRTACATHLALPVRRWVAARRLRTVLGALIVGGAAAIGVLACDPVAPAADATPTLAPDPSTEQRDPMVPVVRGRLENRLRIPGLVEALGQEILSFDVPGVVATVRGQRGVMVQQGSVLAELDAESLNAQIGAERESHGAILEQLTAAEARLATERAAAERALLAARAELAERERVWEALSAPASDAEVFVAQARLALLAEVLAERHAAVTAAERSVDALVAIARAERALREADLADAQAERDALPEDASARELATADAKLAAAELAAAEARVIEQQAAGPDGPPQLRAARRARTAAELDLLAAQGELGRLTAGPSAVALAAAEAALASAQYEYDLAAEALAGLDAGATAIAADVKRLQAESERIDEQVALLEDRLTRLEIVAPYDGIISRVLTVRGREIAPGEPAVELARASDLVFEAVATTAQVANLHVDQVVEVTLREFADTPLEGTVVTLPLDTGDASDKPFIQLAVPWGDRPVTIGMQGVISVLLGASDGVLKVPATAVWTVNGRSFVETLIDGRRRTLPVTLGMQTDDEVEIVHGLSEGDMVFATVRS